MAARELSRRQIKYRLGCSISQIQRWEAQGKLTGRRERAEGYSLVWFPLEQVQKLQREWVPRRSKQVEARAQEARFNTNGKLAAQAFRMFTSGATLVQVVDALEIDPLLVDQFWREYQLSFERRDELRREREKAEADRIEQRRKDRADSLEAYRKHQIEIAEINRKATIEAAERAARIVARRTG